MKLLILIALAGCTAMEPKLESDLRFCLSDEQCAVHRTGCGKVVAYNLKFQDFVKREFEKREKKSMCQDVEPDNRRHRAVCDTNTCSLLSF